MAASKPVIATKQGGAVEMILQNETGLLIPINEPKKAASMAKELVIDNDLRKKLGAAGKIRVEKQFSQAKFRKELIKVLE
jgi:glycosyltransferase involved in cell wall biosynthesis